MTKSKGAFNSAQRSVGLNGSLGSDEDDAAHTFMDMNGDGLEDKVWNDGRVALSLGYKFAPATNWSFSKINSGNALDYGAGLGVSISNGSIQSGISVCRTENQSQIGFIDLNDDALLDQIVSTSPLMVRFNTGSGFTPEVEWAQNLKIDEGISIGESANIAGTICLEFLFFRVCFNPSTYTGQGTSGVHTIFQDINGDGYPDYLEAANDDAELIVRNSRIGRSNFLKTIHNATVGSMDLDYSFVGNSYDIPFSKWVTTEVKTSDGVAGDGVDILHRKFYYKEGKYDRHERQFYGFGQVTEENLSENQVERSIVTEYDVASYYTKGLSLNQKLVDKEQNVYKEISQSYFLQDLNTGAILPPAFVDSDDGMAFPALALKKTTYYEGETEGLSHTIRYSYDTLNIIGKITDEDEAGSVKTTEYSYDYDFENYLLDRNTKEIILSSDGLLRHTEYTLNEVGDAIEIKRKIDSNTTATVDLAYDRYGNIIKTTRPPNANNERLAVTIAYDENENQYPISETDSYGYSKYFNNEYLHNQLTSSTDINGNITEYEHDARGRTITISYPYEVDEGLPYSIKLEYNPMATVPHAKALHYDPEYETDLDVHYFEDGLQRNIQTKTKAELSDESGTIREGYIVTGTDILDGLGRTVLSYLPIEEFSGNPSGYNGSRDNQAQPSATDYDLLDRPVSVSDTYGNTYTYDYTLAQDNQGRKLLAVQTTDALMNKQSEYYNTRGDIEAQKRTGPEGDIWTNYSYDDLSQATKIIDSYGNETKYNYDLLGRRTAVKVPDAGLTQLYYDAANNLTKRVTATINEVISEDGAIHYSYDHERLIQIDYPKQFQNKVQIHYGAPQDSFNRAGRIWLQEDATGGREYFFDSKGLPTKTIRTVMINRSKVYTYVSENVFDTWGRIQRMIYPDGEQLHYQYNKGGLLVQMQGHKAQTVYDYLQQAGYDKFKDRIYLKYGNDAVDNYHYDDKGRLSHRKLFSGNRELLSDERYDYDAKDNIVSKQNTAGGTLELGGQKEESYIYDQLYRLVSAVGQHNDDDLTQEYNLYFDYDDLNNLLVKDQSHEADGQVQTLTSRELDFEYAYTDQPTRPSVVAGKDYYYDPNGNLLLRNSQSIFDYDQFIYDEENRLMGSSNNGYISRYTYDAFGHRALKSHGESQGIFMNGAPAGYVEHKVNYAVEVSPYFSVYENEYRKHYFIGADRFMSKIGTGRFQTTLGQGPQVTAGAIDYKSRIQQYENSILDYYGSLGVAPGPPGLMALLGQPEITAEGLPEATNQNPYTTPPANWPLLASPDSLGPPGVPVFYEYSNINNNNVQAGYNFTDGALTREVEVFYYHYDNTRSTQYVTDYIGNPRQYAAYFPSGEKWISQCLGIDSSEYFYNGLKLDEETGFYQIGDIVYDPTSSTELSLDPVLQNFGQKTFLRRPEGSFYYDYSEQDVTDTAFDNEILNSERPDPFLGEIAKVINQNSPDEEKVVRITIGKRKQKAKNIDTNKQAVINELADLMKGFTEQDPDSVDNFYYPNFNSYSKVKLEKRRYKKRLNKLRKKRKMQQKNKRKVRFK